MPPIIFKIFVVILIVIGEGLAIYAEMTGAQHYNIASQPFVPVFLKMFLLFAFAGGFLVGGYILGFNAFKNIWIVSVASITSILIIEPTLAYIIFQQLPTKGAAIGLLLGLAGFIAAIFF